MERRERLILHFVKRKGHNRSPSNDVSVKQVAKNVCNVSELIAVSMCFKVKQTVNSGGGGITCLYSW